MTDPRNRPISLQRCRMLRCLVALFCLAGIALPAWAQFETRATQLLPNETLGIITGDFNHDGKIDVATVGDYLSIFLGNGDGTFQPAVNYSGGGDSIATADFNNDGVLDLITANGSSVSVYLGNGDGTFQSPKITPTTTDTTFVAVGDFNSDGKMDAVVNESQNISVLLGNGDGTFQTPIDNASFPGDAYWLAVGDFNNDHRLDVAAVGYYWGTLLGNGNGTLQDATTYSSNYSIWSVATGDFNRDGNLDLVIGAYFGGAVWVFLGNGDGTFQPGVEYPAGGGDGVMVGDFNHDGIPDIVMGFSLLLGNGDGTFRQTGCSAPTGSANVTGGLEAAGDFNGDGLTDLVYIHLDHFNHSDVITTALNTGTAIICPSTPIIFPTQLIGTTSAPTTVTITNSGTSPLTFSSVTESGLPFHMQTTCNGDVAPGGTCSIDVTFAPQAENAAVGSITLHDSASSKPQIIELAGEGTVVKVVPRKMTFPTTKSGTHTPFEDITVTNTSAKPLDLTSIEVGGNNGNDYIDFYESNNCPTSLNAGASCTIHVIFAPRHTGPFSAGVYINDTGGGSFQLVPLFGTGD